MTRLAGLFGNASVGYKISGTIEVIDMKEILGDQAEGRIFFRENHSFTTVTVPISNQVSILVDKNILVLNFPRYKIVFTTFSVGVFVCG